MIILDRSHPTQTSRLSHAPETESFPLFPCRAKSALGLGPNPKSTGRKWVRACFHPLSVAFLLDAGRIHMASSSGGGFAVTERPQGTVHEFSAQLLDGRTVSLEVFRGRVLLIVNTASDCGFTPQYAGLQALFQAYRQRGFEVLGF